MSARAFIQARMTSARFPGKVLALLAGRPVIAHVLDRVAAAIPRERVVLATSADASDDPLAAYVSGLGIPVFRGALGNVTQRFQQCLKAHPCEWFFRVCADSPLLDASLFSRLLPHAMPGVDLVTNMFPRSFPHGQSLELLNAATFAALDSSRLSAEEQEHVTQAYYRHPQQYRIVNVSSGDPAAASVRLSVDVPQDLERLREYAAGSRAAVEAR